MRFRVFILTFLFLLAGVFPALAADATKSSDIVLLSHQSITHPDSVISSIRVTDDFTGCGAFFYAPVENADPTAGALIKIQYSVSTAGNEDWVTFPGGDFAAFDTAAADEALTSASEPAGSTQLEVADADTGWSVGQTVYIQDAGTVADGEWGYIEQRDTTPQEYLYLADGLTNAKDSSDTIWGAEIFPFCFDIS
jgi:hypothetical protein